MCLKSAPSQKCGGSRQLSYHSFEISLSRAKSSFRLKFGHEQICHERIFHQSDSHLHKMSSSFVAFLSCVTAGIVICGLLFSSEKKFFACGLSCSSTTKQSIPHGGTKLVNPHPTNRRCLRFDEVEEMIRKQAR